jgi:hypothetical protein
VGTMTAAAATAGFDEAREEQRLEAFELRPHGREDHSVYPSPSDLVDDSDAACVNRAAPALQQLGLCRTRADRSNEAEVSRRAQPACLRAAGVANHFTGRADIQRWSLRVGQDRRWSGHGLAGPLAARRGLLVSLRLDRTVLLRRVDRPLRSAPLRRIDGLVALPLVRTVCLRRVDRPRGTVSLRPPGRPAWFLRARRLARPRGVARLWRARRLDRPPALRRAGGVDRLGRTGGIGGLRRTGGIGRLRRVGWIGRLRRAGGVEQLDRRRSTVRHTRPVCRLAAAGLLERPATFAGRHPLRLDDAHDGGHDGRRARAPPRTRQGSRRGGALRP